MKINTEAASQERLKTDEKFKGGCGSSVCKNRAAVPRGVWRKDRKQMKQKKRKNLQEVERLGSVFLLFFAHVARVEMSFG